MLWASLLGFVLAVVFVAFLIWRFARNASVIEAIVILFNGDDKYRKRRP